jgi:hypothetical protein
MSAAGWSHVRLRAGTRAREPASRAVRPPSTDTDPLLRRSPVTGPLPRSRHEEQCSPRADLRD